MRVILDDCEEAVLGCIAPVLQSKNGEFVRLLPVEKGRPEKHKRPTTAHLSPPDSSHFFIDSRHALSTADMFACSKLIDCCSVYL